MVDDRDRENQPAPDGNGSDPNAQDEPLWSPLQFGVRHLLIGATLVSFGFALAKASGLDWFTGCFVVAILGLFCWMIWGCLRLCRLSRREQLLQLLRRKRRREAQAYRLEHARRINETAPVERDTAAEDARAAEITAAPDPPCAVEIAPHTDRFPAIRTTDTGFRLVGSGRTPLEVKFADVVEIVAFKRDIFAYDVICLGFRPRGSDEFIETVEDFPGFQNLVEAVEDRFALAEDWWRQVAFPAFAANWLTIWKSNSPG